MQLIKKLGTGVLLLLFVALGGGFAWLEQSLQNTLQQLVTQTEDWQVQFVDAGFTLTGGVQMQQVKAMSPDGLSISAAQVTLHQAFRLYPPDRYPDPLHITLNDIRLALIRSDDTDNVLPLFNALGYGDFYVSSSELRNLGYGLLTGDVVITARPVDAGLQLDIEADFHAWGGLKLHVQLQNLPSLPAQLPRALPQLELHSATLTYEEHGLITRLMDFLARRQAQPAETLRQTLANKISSDLLQSGLNLDTSIDRSLQDFIRHPQSLTLRLTPTQPISFDAVMRGNPLLLIQQLGMTMQANTAPAH